MLLRGDMNSREQKVKSHKKLCMLLVQKRVKKMFETCFPTSSHLPQDLFRTPKRQVKDYKQAMSWRQPTNR